MTAAPSWAARCGSSKHCFKYLFCTLWWNLFCKGCCMVPIRCCRRDFFPACCCGWAALQAGRMECVGVGHCGQLLLPVLPGHGPAAHDAGSILAYQRGIFAAAAFAVLLILGRLGSVGLAGNGYSSPIFLLAASLAGWVLVREAACLTAPLPVSARCWPIWPCDDADCDFTLLSFKLVTWLACWPQAESRIFWPHSRFTLRAGLVACLHRRGPGSAAGSKCGVQENKKYRLSTLM